MKTKMYIDGFTTSDNESLSDMNYAYVNYLTSPNPDIENINKKHYKTSKAEYSILSYNSDRPSNLGDIYRSVVYSASSDEETLLAFSPPTSLELGEFKSKHPVLNDDYVINECIEGTMMNLFYDSRIESWELATKGAIGGNYHFYRTQYPDTDELFLNPYQQQDQPQKQLSSNSDGREQKQKQLSSNPDGREQKQLSSNSDGREQKQKQLSFRQMFMDAFRANVEDDINSLPFLEYFSKEYSYTFVVQHPANHIVQNIKTPLVYLVAVYHICDNRAVYIPAPIYEEWNCFLDIRGMLEFPERVAEIDSPQDYDYLSQNFNTKTTPTMGWMITHMKTGDRCHIENPEYTELRELRGNNPNLFFQFLCLNRIDKVTDFIKFFPQYRGIFYRFHQQYTNYVTKLHEFYVSYYVKKEGKRVHKKYFPHIYKMHHTVYLPSLTNETDRIIMRKSVVRDYVKTVDPKSLLYYLNYRETEN